MGLNLPILRFLAGEHRRKPFESPVLTLGRQYVFATYDQVRSMLISEGIQPQRLDPSLSLETNIPKWRGTPRAKFTSDVVFFRLLGIEQSALDVSDYQNADIILDLNVPIPAEFEGCFGLIVDGGTLEHVFDTRQALMNISRMLKPGGRVIHLSPSSNWAGHAFYQFSPGLFFDYYGVNGFVDLRCLLVEMPLREVLKSYGPPTTHSWEAFECKSGCYDRLFVSNKMLGTFFCAEKTDASTSHIVPQQGQFQISVGSPVPNTQASSTVTIVSYLKRRMPLKIKKLIRLVLSFPRRLRLRHREARRHRKPWGLKYMGKL